MSPLRYETNPNKVKYLVWYKALSPISHVCLFTSTFCLVMKQITQLNRTLYNSVLCLFSTLEGWRLKFIAAGFEFRISRNETKYCKTETRKRTFSSRVWLIMYSREKYIHRKLFHLSCGKYFIWQPFILDVFPNLFFVCFPSSILKLCSSNIPGNKQRATFLKLSSLRQYFKTRENCYAR